MNLGSCSRPTCAGKPAAWLAYDYRARCAWIDDPVDDPIEGPVDRSSRWPLCTHHANTLQVPRGWSRVDRRAPLGQQSLGGPGFDAGHPDAGHPDAGHPDDGDNAGDEYDHDVSHFSLARVSSRIH
jgi:Protein of unknown function (DUF3499)